LAFCPSEIVSNSRTFVGKLSPSIKRLLDSLPVSGKNKNHQHVQNELTLLVEDQKTPDKSLIFGRNNQFAERDDVGDRQTYMVKPKYPFEGQKQAIKPENAGRASISQEPKDYSNDLSANGGDAGAPVRKPVASVNSRPSAIMTNSPAGNPITPVLVSHNGVPHESSNGVKPSGYSNYNAVYSTGSANRLGQSFNCPRLLTFN
jgi:hypothetical protein